MGEKRTVKGEEEEMTSGLWCDACNADLEQMRVQINDLLGIWGGKLQAVCPVCNYMFPIAVSPTGRVFCVNFQGKPKQRPDWLPDLGEEGEGPRYAVDDKQKKMGRVHGDI